MAQQININDSISLHPTDYTGNSGYTTSTNASYQISNGYTDSSSTTYARLQLSTGGTGVIFYTFDTPEIPAGATITGVTATARIRVSSTSRVTNTSAQLYSGSTAKGSSVTFASTSTTNTFNLTPGTWTANELQDIRLRVYAQGSSSGSQTRYVYFYGATFTINYTIQTTEYSIIATSSLPEVTVSPATQEAYAGETISITIDAASLDDVTVTDNDVDVTNLLVQEISQPGSYSDTFIPSEFDTANSVYDDDYNDGSTAVDGVYSGNVPANGLADSNSTTRCALYSVQGSGSISKMYYNFDCSSIPNNVTITSVSCTFKGGSQGTSYYSDCVAQLTTGTTLKGTSQEVSGSNSSPSTVTINGGSSWTRAELDDIKILFQVTRGSSNTTTGSTWSFFGATLTVNYEITATNPYYWTYEITNLDDDHVILIEQAGAFIPPEEDPEYTYYPITISSINAVTAPTTGTTRVVDGSNLTVTITPSDPQLTLALDNGVDITSQLIGGIPTNTYTVTTQVSGASYGFNLNNSTGYYVSTNDGVSKSASVARLNMDFESDCLVTIQYINYAEISYDYGMFGKLDTAVATDGLTASSNSSSPSDSTSNYQLAMASNSPSAQTITYNVPSGEHFIDIKYGKDDATDSNNDSLQWKVLSVEATSAGGDYTYTLTNIQAAHSLIFVFGDVNYYFINSSGTGCRLYPNGQSVELEGASHLLTIVPNNYDDVVTLTDNGVAQVLTQETGIDKNGDPAVSYQYRIASVNAAHTLVVTSVAAAAANNLYLKSQDTWIQVIHLYVKENGTWVEQDLTYLSDNDIKYLRKGN